MTQVAASPTTHSLPKYSHELTWPDGMDPYRIIDDTGTQGDPFEHYAWMREHHPVLRCATPQEDVWMVARHADVRKGLRSPKVFRSNVNEEVPLAFLTLMDGPDHVRLRKVVAAAFTPKAINALEDRVRDFVNLHLDTLLERGTGEVVEDFAKPVTMGMIAGLLEVPLDEDLNKIMVWSDEFFNYFARIARSAPGTPNDEAYTMQFFKYLLTNLRRLHAANSDSIGGHIARAWLNDGLLSEKEAKELVAFIFVSGFETTTRLISAAFREFKDNPGLMDTLRGQPELMPRFVEELIRLRGPVNRAVRRTVEDVEVQGVTIPAGSTVRFLIASANRDPEVWGEDADQINLHRESTDHMAFSHGIHTCLGAPLARLEARIASEELVRRVEGIDFDKERDLVLLKGNSMPVGVDSLKVAITPRVEGGAARCPFGFQ
jgi:cytochrome P450